MKVVWESREYVFAFVLALCPLLPVTVLLSDALLVGVVLALVLFVGGGLSYFLNLCVAEERRFLISLILMLSVMSLLKMCVALYMSDVYARVEVYLSVSVMSAVLFPSRRGDSGQSFFALLWGLLVQGFVACAFLFVVAFLRELLAFGSLSLRYVVNNDTFGTVLSFQKVLADVGLVYLQGWPQSFQIFGEPAGSFLLVGVLMAVFQMKALKAGGVHEQGEPL